MQNLYSDNQTISNLLMLLLAVLLVVLLIIVVLWLLREKICRWACMCYRRCTGTTDPSGASGLLTVRGRVNAADQPGLDSLDAVIVKLNSSRPVTLARIGLSESGEYETKFSQGLPGESAPDIQVQVQVRADGREIAISPVFIAVPPGKLQVDIDLPRGVKAAISEFEDLQAKLRLLYGDDSGGPDPSGSGARLLGYAAAKSGWDARALAMAGLAMRLSKANAGPHPLAPALFYALFRSGVPGSEGAAFRVAVDSAVNIWRRAGDNGVIVPLSDNELVQAKAHFLALASGNLLSAVATPGTSSLGEVLSVTFNRDVPTQQKMAELLAIHGSDPTAFWAQAGSVLTAAQTLRLRTDVQLANFTFGSAPMMLSLRPELDANATNLEELALIGYGEPGRWQALVQNSSIPGVVDGDSVASRQARYAELLSAQLRLEYPVAAMSHAVAQGLVPVAAPTRAPMAAFLFDNRNDYLLGEEPLEQYLARTQVSIALDVRTELKKVERVYQMTPTDHAMRGLLGEGIDSAWKVVQFAPEEFTSRYAAVLGGEAVTTQIMAKAHQIHAVVANLAVAFHAARAAPVLGLGSASVIQQSVSRQALAEVDTGVAATLQRALGEQDYCACEHCRSILSPAAYFVSLLQLCDPSDNPPVNKRRPIQELLRRRPDLEHLPLTCENTNTPLPQIDLANEALEYFVDTISNNPAEPMSGYRGFNTIPGIASQDLLTEPQNVRTHAYTWLDAAKFPTRLPFNEPLESLREYLGPFGWPLAQAMEVLRNNDNLERANAQSYAWRDILIEELRLSRAEYELLTDSSLSIRELYGFPAAGVGEPDVPDSLRKAGMFATRIGISFEELSELLQTRFVNPNAWLLPMAGRLGVTLVQIKAFVATVDNAANNDAFRALLSAGLDEVAYGGSVATWVRTHAASILGLLTLHDPRPDPDPCDFSGIEFRYGDPAANGGEVSEIEFVRLIRFVRLWRKLEWPVSEPDGAPTPWSIAEVDAALAALYPLTKLPLTTVDADNLARLDAGFAQVLLRLGALHRLMRLLGAQEQSALQPLLACAAPMQGTNAGSLYHSLFLSAGFLRLYPSFAADAAARPLGDSGATLASQANALQAACQVSAPELALIVRNAGIATNATLADQPTAAELQQLLGPGASDAEKQYALRYLRTRSVTRIYCRSWLARSLKVSPVELLQLSEFTGLALDSEWGVIAANKVPNSLEVLVRLLLAMRAAGVSPSAALLVFWNHDLLGAAASTPAAALSFAANCRAELSSVEAALQPTDDPDGHASGQLIAASFGADTAGTYLAFIERSAVTELAYAHNDTKLSAAILAASDGGLAYDDALKRLRYIKGVMPDAVRTALLALAPAPTANFGSTVDSLYTKSRSFLAQLMPTALRQAHDDFQASAAPVEQRRRALLAALIKVVKPLQRRQALLKVAAQALGASEGWIADVLTDASAFCASRDATSEALADFLALGDSGVKADYFFGNVVGAVPDATDAQAGSIDYGVGLPRSLPANGNQLGQPIACRWTGYLEVPEAGHFNLSIETDGALLPSLGVDGSPIALQQMAGGRPVWRTQAPLNLPPKKLVAFELSVKGVSSHVTLKWQPVGTSEATTPAQALYQPTQIEDVIDTFGRALRGQWVRETFALGEAESLALLALPELRVNVGGGRAWLGALPIRSAPLAPLAEALTSVLHRLLDYSRVRREIGATSESMLQLLQDPAALVGNAEAALMRQAGWSAAAVDAVLARLGFLVNGIPDRPALRDPTVAARVHDALRGLNALGVSPADAFFAIGNVPGNSGVRSLYAAMRARHEAGGWATLIKPINDKLRARRRDGLVAYALAALANQGAQMARINTADRLYEYLLLDVQVHPRVETSRMRSAIAAVQQFIQRCVELPNQEPNDIQVPLAMREQWPWMKRYRVWEANRKVFLYPENWLEPELRDDQSPFFRETMSELLQGDISEERASEAMLSYLRKLEEVSQLEPCGLHVDTRETAADASDDVLHVVARSNGANRKYHYRRREPSGWTPWEPVKLDIEDNPILPYRWKGRLFLFWLKTLQEPAKLVAPSLDAAASLGNQTGASLQPKEPQQRVTAMLCWSEYAHGKWGATRTSSTERAVFLGLFTAAGGTRPFNRGDFRLRAELVGVSLEILIDDAKLHSPGGDPLNPLAFYRLHNAFSEPDARSAQVGPIQAYITQWPARTCWTNYLAVSTDAGSPSVNALSVTHRTDTVWFRYSPTLETLALFRRRDGLPGACVAPYHDALSLWHRTAPFFYSDSKYAFFLTPINVNVKAVSAGPLTTWLPGTVSYTLPPRLIVFAEDNSGYVRTGKSRVLLDSENDFEVGGVRVGKYGARFNNL